jgi:enamine deaminase RidA (YjgF/YER057c/UK114 family)
VADVKLIRSVVSEPSMLKTTGEYAQCWRVGDLVVMQGQTGITLDGYNKNEFVGIGDPAAQTRQAIENIRIMMEAAGGSLADVVKMTVYVTDRSYRPAVYGVIGEMFPDPKPCSTGVVAGLADERLLVEIDAWGALRDA